MTGCFLWSLWQIGHSERYNGVLTVMFCSKVETMISTNHDELQKVIASVPDWPALDRITLARKILETVEETTAEHPGPSGFYMEVVDDDMAAVLRQKSACERLQIADRMWIGARSVIRASILSQNPTWTVDEVNRAIVRRVLGKDFPDDAK